MRWRPYILFWLSVLAVFLKRPDTCWSAGLSHFGLETFSLTWLTNSFGMDGNDTGAILVRQCIDTNSSWLNVGSSTLVSPDGGTIWIGTSNQWHFYVLTNDAGYTNAAFLTFQATNLVVPSIGGTNPVGYSISNLADIDLYVSQDPALTNLDPTALAAADKSLSRGGTEYLAYANALPGPYYIGVKCESQRGAGYTLAGVFSDLPLAQTDLNGNQLLRGFPAPVLIPGGTASQPGSSQVFCVATDPTRVRRVVVSNTLSHPSVRDLTGTLSHAGLSVMLNNHSTNGAVADQSFIYDDSGEGDLPGSQRTDGPGHLTDFNAHPGRGPWQMVLSSTNQPGTNESLWVWLENQPDLTAGLALTIPPGTSRLDYLKVPPEATNLTMQLALISGGGPLDIQLCPAGGANTDCQGGSLSAALTNASVSVSSTTLPPLHAGFYQLRLSNSAPETVSLTLQAVLGLAAGPLPTVTYVSPDPLPIASNGITALSISVTNTDRIVSVEAGVRIDHPRVSDLVLRLINPQGQSVLLAENRGGSTTNGMGLSVTSTNTLPSISGGGSQAVTNFLDTGQRSGLVTIDYDFLAQPDTLRVYYDGALIYDSGFVSYTGHTNLAYGPGSSTVLTFVVNEGGNPDSSTAWNYTLSYTRTQQLELTFTENTNLTTTPIKFAPLPLTNYAPLLSSSNAVFYLPEQSLDQLAGRAAAGMWKLEIWDTAAGNTNPSGMLQQWSLTFRLQSQEPLPLVLSHDIPATNSVAAGNVQWFAVAVPPWAGFATNSLISASQPVNLLFNGVQPPTGTNAGDLKLLAHSGGGSQVLGPRTSPALAPGATYFLGVQNTNATAVTFVFKVDFDVTPLAQGVPVSGTVPVGPQPRMFSYTAAPQETALEIQLLNLSGNAQLVLCKGLPFPTASAYDYGSFQPGTNAEQIILFTNSWPVPLGPGPWYIAVYNADSADVSFTVLVTDSTNPIPFIIPLSDGLSYPNTTSGGTGSADYYSYLVAAGSARAQFEVNGPTADVTLVARRGLPLPTLDSFDFHSANPGANDQIITVFNNSSPLPLAPGEWYLAVVAIGGDPASYSVKATAWSDPGTNVVLLDPAITAAAFSFGWQSLPGLHYFIQAKTNLTDPTWTLLAPMTATDYSSSYSLALPSPFQFFRVGQEIAPSGP